MSPRIRTKNYTRHELGRLLLNGPDGIVGISTTPGSVQYAVTLTERDEGELLISSPEVIHGWGLPLSVGRMLR